MKKKSCMNLGVTRPPQCYTEINKLDLEIRTSKSITVSHSCSFLISPPPPSSFNEYNLINYYEIVTECQLGARLVILNADAYLTSWDL